MKENEIAGAEGPKGSEIAKMRKWTAENDNKDEDEVPPTFPTLYLAPLL